MRSRVIGALFILLGGLYWWTQNQAEPPSLDVLIFDFEKQSLKEVVIHQPGQEVRMVEDNGVWTLVQADNEASTTMVNRSKHQLHRLQARSIVERNPVDLDNYGLGSEAIQVDLSLRGGQTESLLVGSANPTGVSYYMMPLSGPHKGSVLTVAKASVDFFGSELSEFRAEHFVQFDLKSVDSIKIVLSESFVRDRGIGLDERTWVAQRGVLGEFHFWKGGFTDRSSERVSSEFMRRLLGRYLALKSKGYKGMVELSDVQAGLDTPIVSTMMSGSGVDLALQIGNSVSDGLRYFSVNGLTERVMARDGLLEDYDFSDSKVRNPLLLDCLLYVDGLTHLTVTINHEESSLGNDKPWTWNDVEVSASTVNALLQHAAELRVIEWKEESSEWGFVPHADPTLLSTLAVQHDVQSIALQFGDTLERNMAMTPTDPPQIVQYRQTRVQYSGQQVDVLIEEHWFTELMTRYSQLSESSQKGEQ